MTAQPIPTARTLYNVSESVRNILDTPAYSHAVKYTGARIAASLAGFVIHFPKLAPVPLDWPAAYTAAALDATQRAQDTNEPTTRAVWLLIAAQARVNAEFYKAKVNPDDNRISERLAACADRERCAATLRAMTD